MASPRWKEGQPTSKLRCFSLNPLWTPSPRLLCDVRSKDGQVKQGARHSQHSLFPPRNRKRKGYLFATRVLVCISRIVWSRTNTRDRVSATTNVYRGFVKQLVDRMGPIYLVSPGWPVSYLLLDMESIALCKARRRYARAQLLTRARQFSRFKRRPRWCVFVWLLYPSVESNQCVTWSPIFFVCLEFLKVCHFDWIKKYGNIYRAWGGFRPVAVISSPELMEVCQWPIYLVALLGAALLMVVYLCYAQPILASQKLITKGTEYTYLSPWLGNCMFLTTGES